MPTVILLDSSLSMSRLATPNPNPNSPIELSSTGRSLEHSGGPKLQEKFDFWLEINRTKDGEVF